MTGFAAINADSLEGAQPVEHFGRLSRTLRAEGRPELRSMPPIGAAVRAQSAEQRPLWAG